MAKKIILMVLVTGACLYASYIKPDLSFTYGMIAGGTARAILYKEDF